MQLAVKTNLQVLLLISALILLWISIIQNQILMFTVLFLTTVIMLILFYNRILYKWILYKKIHIYIRLHNFTKNYNENTWYMIFTKNKYTVHILHKFSTIIYSDIQTAGVAMDPYLETTKSLGRAILFFLISVPTTFLLYVYFEQPILLLSNIIVPIILLWPKIKLIILTSERKAKIEDEVAFFSIYVWVLQTIGGSLVDIISGMRGSRLLPHIEKEAEMMSRDIWFFPENPLDVVNKRALKHPNQMLRNLFVGYVSIYKDGGDLINYMEKSTENLFSQLESRFRRYEEHAKNIAILTNAMFSMLPIFLVAGMFIMTVNALSSFTSLLFIILPITAAAIYTMADFIQPKFADDIKFNPISVFVGIIGILFGFFIIEQLWATMILGVLFFAITNMLLTFTAISEIKTTNAVLGDFLRDITESRKVGNPISVAIHRLVKNRKYNRSFDRIIFNVATQLHFGTPLSKCIRNNHRQIREVVRIRSWLGRMSFFMLGKMEEAGDVNAQSLEILTEYMIKIKNIRQELVASLQMFWILAYANPFIMVYISKMLKGWFENNSVGNGLKMDYLSTNTLSASPEFLDLINITIVLSSIILGILMNKIVNFSISRTENLIVISAITFVAIWAEPYYPVSL